MYGDPDIQGPGNIPGQHCGTLELICAEERPRLWPPLGQLCSSGPQTLLVASWAEGPRAEGVWWVQCGGKRQGACRETLKVPGTCGLSTPDRGLSGDLEYENHIPMGSPLLCLHPLQESTWPDAVSKAKDWGEVGSLAARPAGSGMCCQHRPSGCLWSTCLNLNKPPVWALISQGE